MKKIIGLSLFAPFLAFAATAPDASTIIGKVGTLINQIAPILFALAFIWFLWNIVKYIEAGGGDAKARDLARDNIIYAIVLLFVMVSVWGLIGVIQTTFGVNGGTAPAIQPPAVTI